MEMNWKTYSVSMELCNTILTLDRKGRLALRRRRKTARAKPKTKK